MCFLKCMSSFSCILWALSCMQPGKKSLVLNVLTLQPLRAVTQEGGFFPYSKHACSGTRKRGSTMVTTWSSCSNVLCNNLDETMLKFELPLFCPRVIPLYGITTMLYWGHISCWTFRVNGLCSHTNGPLSSQHHAICGLRGGGCK